jgi:hypothetical protein
MPNARLQVFDGGHLVIFPDRGVWPTILGYLRDPA